MIEIPPLSTLDPVAVAATQPFVTQRVGELVPETDSRRGPVHDLVLYTNAVLATAYAVAFDQLRQSLSLSAVAANPDLADADTVDKITANFLTTRDPGTKAGGTAVIVLTKFAPSNVPAGGVFVAGGVRFITEHAFAGRVTAGSVIDGSSDRLIRPVGDGTYAYTVDLVAESTGVVTAVRRGVRLVPDFPLADLAVVYAESDFAGGADPETNADLVLRLREGIAAKDLSGAVPVSALIRSTPGLARVLAVSSVGHGNPAQVRHRGLFPLAGGSRLDVYVRTEPLPVDVAVTKTAVAVGEGETGMVWQASIGRDDAPGFYTVGKIIPDGVDPETTTGFEALSDVRGVDLSSGYAPDVVGAAEGAYSRYQTAVVRFEDPATAGTAVGVMADYVLYLRAMPSVADVQAALSDPSVRPLGGDVLAKAPVPCDVVITLDIRTPAGLPRPSEADVQAAAAAVVNTTGFSGRIGASAISAEVHKLLAVGQTVGPVDLFARIRRPDGTVAAVRSRDAIVVPYEPTRMVSADTVCFFADPQEVGVSFTVVDP